MSINVKPIASRADRNEEEGCLSEINQVLPVVFQNELKRFAPSASLPTGLIPIPSELREETETLVFYAALLQALGKLERFVKNQNDRRVSALREQLELRFPTEPDELLSLDLGNRGFRRIQILDKVVEYLESPDEELQVLLESERVTLLKDILDQLVSRGDEARRLLRSLLDTRERTELRAAVDSEKLHPCFRVIASIRLQLEEKES
jgi:hypothetical protein